MPEEKPDENSVSAAMFSSEAERHKFTLGTAMGGAALAGAAERGILESDLPLALKILGTAAMLGLAVLSTVVGNRAYRQLRSGQSRQQGSQGV